MKRRRRTTRRREQSKEGLRPKKSTPENQSSPTWCRACKKRLRRRIISLKRWKRSRSWYARHKYAHEAENEEKTLSTTVRHFSSASPLPSKEREKKRKRNLIEDLFFLLSKVS